MNKNNNIHIGNADNSHININQGSSISHKSDKAPWYIKLIKFLISWFKE